MIHEEKTKQGRRGAQRPQKGEKKHLRSDRGAWETAFKKNKKTKKKQHLNHPFTVMQPFVLQYTCTRTRTLNERNHENGEKGYENYYFHVVGDRLDEIKLETTTKNPL